MRERNKKRKNLNSRIGITEAFIAKSIAMNEMKDEYSRLIFTSECFRYLRQIEDPYYIYDNYEIPDQA